MAENLILAQVLVGISALKTKKELDAVKNAVKERCALFPKRTHRNLTEAEKVALAKGNSDEMIRVNKEKFDYIGVPQKDLPKAEKWYMAPPPFWKSRSEYYQYRIWNVKSQPNYKGWLIVEKATGKSVSRSEWEIEEEGDEDEEVTEEDEEVVEEEVTEATVAMEAVRVE